MLDHTSQTQMKHTDPTVTVQIPLSTCDRSRAPFYARLSVVKKHATYFDRVDGAYEVSRHAYDVIWEITQNGPTPAGV